MQHLFCFRRKIFPVQSQKFLLDILQNLHKISAIFLKKGIAMVTAASMYSEYKPLSLNIQRADELPKACMQLVRALAEAPIFDRGDSWGTKCKVVVLSD